jgi:hypothetical protein
MVSIMMHNSKQCHRDCQYHSGFIPIRIFYLTDPDLSINIQLIASMKQRDENSNDEEWEYGDVWKQGTPEGAVPDDVDYVDLFRVDTGMGYDDTVMLDLVGYLGSRGIRATFDSFSMGLEPAAIKTYVLKVEIGKVQEAKEYLDEKFRER